MLYVGELLLLWYLCCPKRCDVQIISCLCSVFVLNDVVFVQLNCSVFVFAKMESVSAVWQLTALQRLTVRRCTVLCSAQSLGAAPHSAAPKAQALHLTAKTELTAHSFHRNIIILTMTASSQQFEQTKILCR